MKQILCLIVLSAVATGCSAPRGLGHTASSPSKALESTTSQEYLDIGKRLSSLTQGSVQSVEIAGQPVQIIVGENYLSALGEECKRLEQRNVFGTTNKAAICQSKAGVWRYLPPLGQETPR